MVEALIKLQNDRDSIKPFFDYFRNELAVNPYLVEKWLNITRTERKCWAEDGKLKILRMQSYGPKEYDGIYEVCMYNRWFIENLAQNTINKWHEEHKTNMKTVRSKSANKTAETRKYIKEHTPIWIKSINIVFNKPIVNNNLHVMQLQLLNNNYSYLEVQGYIGNMHNINIDIKIYMNKNYHQYKNWQP